MASGLRLFVNQELLGALGSRKPSPDWECVLVSLRPYASCPCQTPGWQALEVLTGDVPGLPKARNGIARKPYRASYCNLRCSHRRHFRPFGSFGKTLGQRSCLMPRAPSMVGDVAEVPAGCAMHVCDDMPLACPIHVCMCVCISAYTSSTHVIHTHLHICIYTDTHMCVYIHMCIYTHTCVLVDACMSTYVCMFVHVD